MIDPVRKVGGDELYIIPQPLQRDSENELTPEYHRILFNMISANRHGVYERHFFFHHVDIIVSLCQLRKTVSPNNIVHLYLRLALFVYKYNLRMYITIVSVLLSRKHFIP